jgi:hypothetical protein
VVSGFEVRVLVTRTHTCPGSEVSGGGRNLVMSSPASATMISAVRRPMPGMV